MRMMIRQYWPFIVKTKIELVVYGNLVGALLTYGDFLLLRVADEDGMIISGNSDSLSLKDSIFIESHDDHRIAMSFLIAGLKCSKPITVKNCENILTSFPNFIELTSAIGYKLEK